MPEELSSRQKLAACFLARGWSAARTSHQLGISPRTLYRWRRTKSFSHYIAEKETEITELVGAEETRHLLPDAVKAINELLASPSATARLGAARFILNMHGVANLLPRQHEWVDDVYTAAAHLISEMMHQDDEMRLKALENLRRMKVKPREKRKPGQIESD